jgi:hypothetical protein
MTDNIPAPLDGIYHPSPFEKFWFPENKEYLLPEAIKELHNKLEEIGVEVSVSHTENTLLTKEKMAQKMAAKKKRKHKKKREKRSVFK